MAWPARVFVQRATAAELYLSAQAQEAALRGADSPPASAGAGPSRDAYLRAIAAYRLVVLRYPTSGYCDNALWQAAGLATEAFTTFRRTADRRAAVDLYDHLAKEYPHSRLVAQARAESRRVSGLSPTAPAPPAARPAPAAATTDTTAGTPVLVRSIRRRTTPAGVDVEVEIDGPLTFRPNRLSNPPRIFFDLTPTVTMDALSNAILTYDSGPVRQVRVGHPAALTTRLVLETAEMVECDARSLTGPHRLLVSCRENGQPPVALPPSPEPRAASDATPVAPTPATAGPPSKPPTAPGTPSANGRGGFSIARQLGLRVGRIVIDAGHGGHDPGALGNGTNEAAIVLDVALRLEKLLAKEPGVEVILTRRTNRFIPLEERTAIANREAADLFVSVHANASRNKSARGVETYLLNFASTPDAAAVAARENASSSLTMSHLNDLVKQIALGNKLQESRDLAASVQSSLVKKLRPSNRTIRDLGVKQAPFVVLVGASMPSVLVEISFLSNSQEGRLLATGAYRQHVAEALLEGLRDYLRTLKRAEVVADEAPLRPSADVRRP